MNELLAQETIPPPGPHQKSNESFLGAGVLVLLLAAVVLMGALAWRRAKTRPSSLPEWDDETFEADVLGAKTPVLVHF